MNILHIAAHNDVSLKAHKSSYSLEPSGGSVQQLRCAVMSEVCRSERLCLLSPV